MTDYQNTAEMTPAYAKHLLDNLRHRDALPQAEIDEAAYLLALHRGGTFGIRVDNGEITAGEAFLRAAVRDSLTFKAQMKFTTKGYTYQY